MSVTIPTTLRDVCPSLTFANAENRTYAYPKLGGEDLSGYGPRVEQSPNLNNLIGGEFGASMLLASLTGFKMPMILSTRNTFRMRMRPMLFTARHTLRMHSWSARFALRLSTLSISIRHIVSRRTQEKVIGVDASGGVAGMTHEHTYGDRTMNKRVGIPMGCNLLPVDRKVPVASLVASCRPEPTAFRAGSFINLSPETGFCWEGLRSNPMPSSEPMRNRQTTPTLTEFRRVKSQLDRMLYTSHVLDLLERLRAIPRVLVAPLGFIVPNYSTFGGTPCQYR